jgi:hypothetical protein
MWLIAIEVNQGNVKFGLVKLKFNFSIGYL